MYIIGLTGGIASGKSTAAGILRSLGAVIIDADAIARRITSEGGAAAADIIARFGTLDRAAIARVVFADETERQALNEIVHPHIWEKVKSEIDSATATICVLDVPLLFESGMDVLADESWVVHVPKRMQIERMQVRDGLTVEQAMARIRSQMPTGEKMARADVSIDASGTQQALREKLEVLYDEALRKAEVTR